MRRTDLTPQIKMEIEKAYPYINKIKLLIRSAITTTDKPRYFSILRKAESYISGESAKLMHKPNRATKYVLYMRRLISGMKLMFVFLSEREEMEAYPTLAVILCDFFNILLASSLKNRLPIRQIASTYYCFLKQMFDKDLEYALDVLLCSNVAEQSIDVGSLAYHILAEVLHDEHLYTNDVGSCAKFLTIAALLADQPAGKQMVKNTTQQIERIPTDLKTHLELKYGFPKHHRFNVSMVIDQIQPRKVMSVIRKERLIVVSNKKCSKIEIRAGSSDSRSSLKRGARDRGSTSFFFDISGTYPDRSDQKEQDEVSSTFQTIELDIEDETKDDDVIEDESPSNEDNEEDKEASDEESEVESVVNYDEEEEDHAAEDGHSSYDELGSFTDMYDRRENGSSSMRYISSTVSMPYTPANDEDCNSSEPPGISDLEDNQDNDLVDADSSQRDMSSDEEDTRSNITIDVPSQPVNAVAQKNKPEDSDDDLAIVYEAPVVAVSVTTRCGAVEDEERDLADPESGEDDVPAYDAGAYQRRPSPNPADEEESRSPRRTPTAESRKRLSPVSSPSTTSQTEPNVQTRRQLRSTVEGEEPTSPKKRKLETIEEIVPDSSTVSTSQASETAFESPSTLIETESSQTKGKVPKGKAKTSKDNKDAPQRGLSTRKSSRSKTSTEEKEQIEMTVRTRGRASKVQPIPAAAATPAKRSRATAKSKSSPKGSIDEQSALMNSSLPIEVLKKTTPSSKKRQSSAPDKISKSKEVKPKVTKPKQKAPVPKVDLVDSVRKSVRLAKKGASQ